MYDILITVPADEFGPAREVRETREGFCPNVWTGCDHIMVMDENGHGVACKSH